MPVRVRILGDGERVVEYRPGMRVFDVLKELGLLAGEYVVAKGGRVVAEDEEVGDGEELLLYPVVSGG